MPDSELVIRDLSPNITTFTTPFNRFAPFGYRNFVAVGNRATAIRLHDARILLLNPIQLTPRIQETLTQLGGVHFLAADLGHHMYVNEYLSVWPSAKAIGVPGLEGKRKDVAWSFIYADSSRKPEDAFDFAQDMQTVLFQEFITYCVAWYHIPTKTLIQSDLLMNLPCTEQYHPPSSTRDPLSHFFAKHAHPNSIWFKRLIYYLASVDYPLMRRDAKRVAEWDIECVVPCHGDVILGHGGRAWARAYEWFLEGGGGRERGVWRSGLDGVLKGVRWWFLM